MGTKITLHIEVKIEGVWHHLQNPRLPQRYLLFGKMAGVRDDSVEPLAKPKGLPDDPTFLTVYDYEYDKADALAVSWLSSEEVHELCQWLAADKRIGYESWDLFGFIFGNSYDGFSDFPRDNRPGLEDFRFVFWFTE